MPVVRGKIIEPLFTAEQIAERNHAMAKQIAAGPTKDLLVIAVLKGSFIFAADLIRALHDSGLAPEVEFITLSSYGTGTVSQGVRIVKDIDSDVKDRDVLLIDDILESGRTLLFAKELLYRTRRAQRHASPCCSTSASSARKSSRQTMSASNAPTTSSSATAWMSPMPSASCPSSAWLPVTPDLIEDKTGC